MVNGSSIAKAALPTYFFVFCSTGVSCRGSFGFSPKEIAPRSRRSEKTVATVRGRYDGSSREAQRATACSFLEQQFSGALRRLDDRFDQRHAQLPFFELE